MVRLVRYTEFEKLLKIAVIAECAYTVAHDRVNSLLVHCFITIIYPRYTSECEEYEVNGSQCHNRYVDIDCVSTNSADKSGCRDANAPTFGFFCVFIISTRFHVIRISLR